MRKMFNIMIPALTIAVMMAAVPFFSSCEELYDDVLRVHILANSDSAADQSLKLAVRDRIVSDCAEYYRDCEGKQEAKEITESHLTDIERVASEEISSRGFDYPVRAEVGEAYYNTRYYDDFTMPAGWYDSLRVEIGEARGTNWWCVIYPALCVGAACDSSMRESLSDGEYRVVTSDRFDVRFKLVDYFEGFMKLFKK